MTYESLRNLIDALRESGMTYTAIGAECGADRTSVMRWREGEQRPSGEHLFALIEVAEERIRNGRKALKLSR